MALHRMSQSVVQNGSPFAPEETQKILKTFHREGVVVVPGVLTVGEVAAIREVTDRFLDDPALAGRRVEEKVMGTSVLRYTQSLDRIFCDLLVREPILGLAEAVLGPDCGFCGQN